MSQKELVRPINPGEKRGWQITYRTPEGETINLDPAMLTLHHPGLKTTFAYGMTANGYDGLVKQEPNGGGSVTVPYFKIGSETYIGAVKVNRGLTGGKVRELPRGFSLPEESHQQTAQREFAEETGVKRSVAERTQNLGGRRVNQNSSFDAANPRKNEGVALIGVQVEPDEIVPAHKSDNPLTQTYRFSKEVQGRVTDNAKLEGIIGGIRFFNARILRATSDAFTLEAIARILTLPEEVKDLNLTGVKTQKSEKSVSDIENKTNPLVMPQRELKYNPNWWGRKLRTKYFDWFSRIIDPILYPNGLKY